MDRLKQHDLWGQKRAALYDYYAQHSERGPRGFLAAHAVMGAERVLQTLAEIRNGTVTGGSVWQFDTITREFMSSIATGVHGCPRCGLQRSPQTRTYERLVGELSYLWTDASACEPQAGSTDAKDAG